MAKRTKKREFRPDRTGGGTLSKLLPTKKQRQALLKWTLYALVLVLLSLIQDTLLCNLRIFGASSDLVPCAILLICVLQSAEGSCVFALIASVLLLFSGSAPGSYCIVYLTFLGFGACVLRRSYLRKGFSATALCTLGALLIYELAAFVTCVITGETFFGRVYVPLLTWAMTLLLIPVLYPVALSIDKIGGETWKE